MKQIQLGSITCILGDCDEYMNSCKEKQFDLAIVDTPYGIGEDGSKNHTRSKLATSKNYKSYYGNDSKAPDAYYFKELKRISKNQIIWGANHFIENLPIKNSSCWIVWDKDNGESDFADCELAWSSFSSAIRKFKWKWQGMLQQNMKNKQIRIHPNEKPVELYKWILYHYAKKEYKILDTHGGSFSNAIACYDLGFELVIIEKDEYYFNKAVERLKKHITKCEQIKELGYAKSELNEKYPTLF